MNNLSKKINKLFESSTSRENDVYFYEKALDEYESDNKVKGIYAKALSLSEGDESKVKSKYLDLRVDIFKDELALQEKEKYQKLRNLKKQKKDMSKKIALNQDQEKYINRFAWAPFMFAWVYGLRYRSWYSLLTMIPYIGIIILIHFGFRGRKYAWANTKQDFESFKKENDNWDYWAQFIFILIIILTLISILFF